MDKGSYMDDGSAKQAVPTQSFQIVFMLPHEIESGLQGKKISYTDRRATECFLARFTDWNRGCGANSPFEKSLY